MIDQASRVGQISYHPRCKRLTIIHLCFADDLVVFSAATHSSLLGLKAILLKFLEVSGLAVSFAKSELFCSGVSLDTHTQLADILGLKKGQLPVRYLGVPLSCKKLTAIDCKPLLDKIASRITSWSSRCLSYAGRLQFIDSVLTSLYGY